MRLARVHRLAALEPEVAQWLTTPGRKPLDQIEAIKALRELGSARVELFQKLALAGGNKEAEELRREAITALASAKSDRSIPVLEELWPHLPSALRKLALDKITSSRTQAAALVKAVHAGGAIAIQDLDETALDKLATVLGSSDPDLAALLGGGGVTTQPVVRLNGERGDMVSTGITLSGPFTVEAWVRLDPGISNEDVLLGSPAGPNFNFYDGKLRVYAAGNVKDALIAKTPMRAEMWTHVAITRDDAGQFRIFLNGELNADDGKAWKEPFTAMDIGRSTLAKGTGMALSELRVWNVARNAEEIRNNYQRSMAGEPLPSAITYALLSASEESAKAGTADRNPAALLTAFLGMPKLQGQARVLRTRDFPELITPAAARALDAKFAQFRAVVAQPGKAAHGRALFAGTCAVCHRVKGEGGQIGPDLSGAGAMGNEALLRNVLTPNAQLESGYYRFDVELKSGDLLTGFLVKEDAGSVTVRPIGAEDRTIPRSEISKTKFARKSLMPEGLLDGMQPQDVSDLFAYLGTLK